MSNPSNPIAAIMIHAADWQRAYEWYRSAFPNAKEVQVEEYEFRYLKIGNIALEIVQADEKVSAGTAGTVVYWQTNHFDARLKYLLDLGAELYRGPKRIEKGKRMCQVKDPFGNLIGLREGSTSDL
ncbi:MAG: VOC family protein [Pseudomonadales bacterium]